MAISLVRDVLGRVLHDGCGVLVFESCLIDVDEIELIEIYSLQRGLYIHTNMVLLSNRAMTTYQND